MCLLLSHSLRPTNLHVFGFMRSYNSWTSSIRNSGSSPHKVLRLYSQMHRIAVPFDSFTINFTVKSCSRLPHNLPVIRHLHAHSIKLGFITHVYVATPFLNAYAAVCFDDAHFLFDEMSHRNTVTWNTMITGYSRLGKVDDARLVFDEMPIRDVASWSAMISAYINNGCRDSGLALFREMMENRSVMPDQVTVGSILFGCTRMGSLGLLVGKSVHGFIVKNEWQLNEEIGTGLVDMYAKCGLLKNSCEIFQLMKERNVMSWTALICGSSQNGRSREALALFDMMQEAGISPNEMTFTGILSACAQAGLIEEGYRYFKMIEDYDLKPRIQHYGCMIDLLGKAGLLEEAYEIIKTMSFKPNVVIWGAFLSACKEHKQFQMAEKVIDRVLLTIKPENDGGLYSLISYLYSLNGRWDDAERVRQLMVNQSVRKVRGSSFIRSGL